MGTKYLEHCGQITITNSHGDLSCTLDFKETGYWGTSPNVVSGKVFDKSQNVLASLEGRWDEQISQVIDEFHLKVLWKSNPFPRHAPDYYGLTSFATTLNEITPDLESKLPPSDSRFRPDIRAMEEGKIERANEEKSRLEEEQRLRREQRHSQISPQWFLRVPDSDEYVYKGGYWEQREKGWLCSEPWWRKP
jgi:oxysterol-binding protein-related protein 3/6/7